MKKFLTLVSLAVCFVLETKAQKPEAVEYYIASSNDLSMNTNLGGLNGRLSLLVSKPEYKVWLITQREAIPDSLLEGGGTVSEKHALNFSMITDGMSTEDFMANNPLLVFSPSVTFNIKNNNIPFTPAIPLKDFNAIYSKEAMSRILLALNFYALSEKNN